MIPPCGKAVLVRERARRVKVVIVNFILMVFVNVIEDFGS